MKYKQTLEGYAGKMILTPLSLGLNLTLLIKIAHLQPRQLQKLFIIGIILILQMEVYIHWFHE